MKSNSGISLISVVIMIVIMIILAKIAMSSGVESVNEANETKVAVEIAELKKAVANKMIENETSSTVRMPGINVSGDVIEYMYYIDSLENSELQEFLTQINEEKLDYYRLVDSVAAAALGVSSVQADHYFIVDYYTGKVYGTVNMDAYRANQIVEP